MGAGDPFDLVGDEGQIGVLCVHGFTGSPADLRFLGAGLQRAGYHVHGMRLPGHGTRIADLDATTWSDWANAVEAAFDEMRLACSQVAVVGQSLGGLLALHLASKRRDVAAVASLAAPLWLPGLSARVANLAEAGSLPVRAIPKFSGSDARDKKIRRGITGYDAIPVRALGELVRFMRVVDQELASITQPVLVLHAREDHTAPVACATRIAEQTRAVRMRILDRSYHLIASDVERDIVAAEVVHFLRDHVRAATGELACAM